MHKLVLYLLFTTAFVQSMQPSDLYKYDTDSCSFTFTPLDEALIKGKVATAEYLLKNRLCAITNESIINCFCVDWNKDIFDARKELLRLLFAYGVNPDTVDSDRQYARNLPRLGGKSPLCNLCTRTTIPLTYHKYFVGILLYHGVNTKLKNKDGKTAAELARKWTNGQIAQLIENAHKPLVKKMSNCLFIIFNKKKLQEATFPAMPKDLCHYIAEWHYCNTGN